MSFSKIGAGVWTVGSVLLTLGWAELRSFTSGSCGLALAVGQGVWAYLGCLQQHFGERARGRLPPLAASAPSRAPAHRSRTGKAATVQA